MGRRKQGWKLRAPRKTGGNYQARFSFKGERYELSTGCKDPVAAEEIAAHLYADVVSGRSHTQKGPSVLVKCPLDLLFAEWLASLPEGPTATHYEMYVRAHFLPFFPTLKDINEANARLYVRERLAAVLRRTILKELSAIRGFLGWCCDHGYLDEAPRIQSPDKRYKGTRAKEHRTVVLDDDQMLALIERMPVRTRFGVPALFFRFLWETSLRRGTVEKMLVSDVNLDEGTLTIRDEIDKCRFGRTIALTPSAVEVLRDVMPESGLVFGYRNYTYSLRKAAKAIGLAKEDVAHLSCHDFRHSRITDMVGSGVNVIGIAQVAGHQNIATTNHYVAVREKLGNEAVRNIVAADEVRALRRAETSDEEHRSGAKAGAMTVPEREPTLAEADLNDTQATELIAESRGLDMPVEEVEVAGMLGNLNPARLPIPPLPQVRAFS